MGLTCSFESNCLWTYPEAVKNPLVHLPHVYSQANGLLSPIVNSTVPANTETMSTSWNPYFLLCQLNSAICLHRKQEH